VAAVEELDFLCIAESRPPFFLPREVAASLKYRQATVCDHLMEKIGAKRKNKKNRHKKKP
jgi:hypothetical protein